jgi:hypothetical protein
MRFALHQLIVELAGEGAPLRRDWSLIWAGWPQVAKQQPDVRLSIKLVETLPPLPSAAPYFRDSNGVLLVYRGAEKNTAVLYYPDGALVTVPLTTSTPKPVHIEGLVTEGALRNGRLEDITFTSLAPLLRRHGYYLLHAFAVVKEDHCILLVGASGSGKTTTGLHLLEQGWQLLANDVVLLAARTDGIYALPTPGAVSIRPGTLTLLPGLAGRLGITDLPLAQPITISNRQLHGGNWGESGRVTAVYFPQFSHNPQPITPLPAAVQLAHLMAESIDRWDETALTGHITFLERLSQQAHAYRLPITPGTLPTILLSGENAQQPKTGHPQQK